MDTDTAAAIERLSDSIVMLEQSSRGDFTQLRGDMTELRGETRQLRVDVNELRGETRQLRVDVNELRGETRQLRADVTELRVDMTELRGDMGQLRVELREGLEENRRHAGVLFESLRDDIRVLAEGFATVSTKLDSLQR